MTQLGKPYSAERRKIMAQSLGVKTSSKFIADMVERANEYIAAQEFVSAKNSTNHVRSELKNFRKIAEQQLKLSNSFIVKIDELSPHTKLQIRLLSGLQNRMKGIIAPLMDSINATKRPIEGTSGRRLDTIRDNFLLEIVSIYTTATNKEFKVRALYTDHRRKGPDKNFLFAATTGLPGFQNITEQGIEKALERALKR